MKKILKSNDKMNDIEDAKNNNQTNDINMLWQSLFKLSIIKICCFLPNKDN
jgi:hypothetical protein